MGRRVALKLTVRLVQSAKHPGGTRSAVRLHDGGGLYLQISPSGGKSWLLRYRVDEGERLIGLGSTDDVSLAIARGRAGTCRAKLQAGIDPLSERATIKAAAKVAGLHTFKAVALDFIAAKRDGWSNSKHAAQWTSTLTTYAFPTLGAMAVAAIDRVAVESALESVWQRAPETARRVRSRIAAVLDYARAKGLRTGENPAQWKGNLKVTMAVQAKTGGHHAALPWKQMQTFRDALAKQKGVAARAVEMAIYTAARSGEVRGMTWAEIDMVAGIWTVPAGRMKMDREHRVPLSAVAQGILKEQAKTGAEGLVFPGQRPGAALSDMSLTAVLRRMQPKGALPMWADSVSARAITAHGFRATFRTWAAEATSFHEAIAEAALSHVEGNKVIAAYSRGDLFDKRIELMTAWADFVTGM